MICAELTQCFFADECTQPTEKKSADRVQNLGGDRPGIPPPNRRPWRKLSDTLTIPSAFHKKHTLLLAYTYISIYLYREKSFWVRLMNTRMHCELIGHLRMAHRYSISM